MLPVLILFGTILCILLLLLLLQRHEKRNISHQLREIRSQNTNALVHSNGSGKVSADLINEINVLIREMQQSRVRYQQKNHALEQMMTNISHDLRTPLTSAMGYLHIIQTSQLSEEEKSREIAIIEKRLLRLEELVNSFFEFSQIISSEKAPEKMEFNMIAVLEESIAHYYDDYCAVSRKILFHCRQHRMTIYSNKNMLLRIFDNLINNALKHGVGDLAVSIDAAEMIRITFENKFYGSDIDMAHIFDEFYTTDISRTKGNTGLGLAIVKQFTDMLGGSVSAQVRAGVFSIIVVLPIKDLPCKDLEI